MRLMPKAVPLAVVLSPNCSRSFPAGFCLFVGRVQISLVGHSAGAGFAGPCHDDPKEAPQQDIPRQVNWPVAGREGID